MWVSIVGSHIITTRKASAKTDTQIIPVEGGINHVMKFCLLLPFGETKDTYLARPFFQSKPHSGVLSYHHHEHNQAKNVPRDVAACLLHGFFQNRSVGQLRKIVVRVRTVLRRKLPSGLSCDSRIRRGKRYSMTQKDRKLGPTDLFSPQKSVG